MHYVFLSERSVCEEAAQSIRETGGGDDILEVLQIDLQVAGRGKALRKIEVTGSTFNEGK